MFRHRLTLFVCLGVTLGASAQTPDGKPVTIKKVCAVNHEPPSEAQKALDREEFDKAGILFEQNIAAKPGDESAVAGLIRTLIEEGKIEDALQRAEALLRERPRSSVALETMGEVLFRRGELQTAYEFAARALSVDPCNARAYLLQSWFEGMIAMHAMRKGHVITAHNLDPDDRQIQWSWILTLPHKEQTAAITEFLSHRDRMTERTVAGLSEYLAHADDYKEDDCKRAPTSPETTSVPLVPITGDPMSRGIDVKFNGKIRQLNVDVSARGLSLSKRAAAALGLTPGQRVAAVGYDSHGPVDGSIVHVDSVKVGQMEFRNCHILVLEKDTLGDEEGWIGANFFHDHLVTLDFPGHRMQIDSLPKRPGEKMEAADSVTSDIGPHDRYIAPEMMSWSNFYLDGQTLLVPTNIGAKHEKLFSISNRYSQNMMSIPAAQEVTKVWTASTARLYGKSGPVTPVMETGLMTWIFAGVGQKVDHVTAIDLTKWSHGLGTEVSGVIGAPILSLLVVHIDYRDNLIKFEPAH